MTTRHNTRGPDATPRGTISERAGSGDEPEPGAPEPKPAEPPPGIPSPGRAPEMEPVREPTPAPSPTPDPMPDRDLPHVIDPVADSEQLHIEQ